MSNATASATLLTADAAARKLHRMAYQIWERHAGLPVVQLFGIERSGVAIAETLTALLREISPLEVRLDALGVKPGEASPLPGLRDVPVVIVDDVASTGRTLMAAVARVSAAHPQAVSVAVLVDRAHKSFPVTPDIVGLTVSTTLQEHIEVVVQDGYVAGAYLR